MGHSTTPRVPVEHVPCLDASKLAWAGILDPDAKAKRWPFDELTEQTRELNEDGHDTPILTIKRFYRRREGSYRVRLFAEFIEYNPDFPDSTLDDWRDFSLVATRPPFGGRRCWFECGGFGKYRARSYLAPCVYPRCRVCFGLTYSSRLLRCLDADIR